MAEKESGREVVLQMGNGATPTEAFTTVANVNSLPPAGSSRALMDASAQGDEWMDYVLGQKDGDEMGITVIYDPNDSGHIALSDAFDAAAPVNFRLRFDDMDFLVEFPALITKFSRGGDRTSLFRIEMSLKILNPGVQDVAGS